MNAVPVLGSDVPDLVAALKTPQNPFRYFVDATEPAWTEATGNAARPPSSLLQKQGTSAVERRSARRRAETLACGHYCPRSRSGTFTQGNEPSTGRSAPIQTVSGIRLGAQKRPFKHRVASSKVRSEAPCPGGIVIPTKRSVYAYQGDYQPVWDPLLVRVDMGEIALA